MADTSESVAAEAVFVAPDDVVEARVGLFRATPTTTTVRRSSDRR
jgi:hypothetical protein